MNIRVFMASAIALAAIASSANALTITAKDNVAYTVKVTPKGAKEIDLSLKANGSAEVDCKSGCQLSLNGNTRAVDGTVSKIFIQGGKFAM